MGQISRLFMQISLDKCDKIRYNLNAQNNHIGIFTPAL
jgi:hypothetical protein